MRILALIVSFAALAGCNRGIDNKEAVRQAVVDYLANRTNLNMNAMNVQVTSVVFRQNEADAVVSFAPKGGSSAAQGLEMRYTLEKKGNQWVVKGRSDSGTNSHGGGMGNPHGGGEGMPMPGGAAPQGEMPPGHPPVGKKE